MWHVKVVPDLTYNVLSGTLSLYTTTSTVFTTVVFTARIVVQAMI